MRSCSEVVDGRFFLFSIGWCDANNNGNTIICLFLFVFLGTSFEDKPTIMNRLLIRRGVFEVCRRLTFSQIGFLFLSKTIHSLGNISCDSGNFTAVI